MVQEKLSGQTKNMVRETLDFDVHKCCGKCGRWQIGDDSGLKLSVCERCRLVYYCSTACQKRDWKSHRRVCGVEVKPEIIHSDDMEDSREPQMKPTGAPTMEEMGKIWQERMHELDPDAHIEMHEYAYPDEPAAESCTQCGGAAKNLKACSACMSVAYCSRDCQKAAWPAHKQVCSALKHERVSSNQSSERSSADHIDQQVRDALSAIAMRGSKLSASLVEIMPPLFKARAQSLLKLYMSSIIYLALPTRITGHAQEVLVQVERKEYDDIIACLRSEPAGDEAELSRRYEKYLKSWWKLERKGNANFAVTDIGDVGTATMYAHKHQVAGVRMVDHETACAHRGDGKTFGSIMVACVSLRDLNGGDDGYKFAVLLVKTKLKMVEQDDYRQQLLAFFDPLLSLTVSIAGELSI